MKRIVIAGGGTGGHIYPSLSVARSLRTKEPKMEIIYIGSGSDLERPLYEIADRSYTIVAGKWRRYFSWKNFTDPFKIVWGWAQSLIFLLREMPDVVFSKGGYVSFPVATAARIYRIPVIIHESDAIPGLSNRILGKFSNKIAVGFRHAREYFLEEKVVFTGNIARPNVREGSKERARETFHLSESKPVVLVLGGSQGSRAINGYMVEILSELLPFAQIVHQTGSYDYKHTLENAKKREGIKPGREGYHPIAFLDDESMRDALAVADVVISRSGATSIAEIAACRKVALLVPLPTSANDHQRMNGYLIAEKGAAMVLEEANLAPHILLGKIKKLLFEKDLREKLQHNIAQFDQIDAVDRVTDMIVDLVKN